MKSLEEEPAADDEFAEVDLILAKDDVTVHPVSEDDLPPRPESPDVTSPKHKKTEKQQQQVRRVAALMSCLQAFGFIMAGFCQTGAPGRNVRLQR